MRFAYLSRFVKGTLGFLALVLLAASSVAQDSHTSGPFSGVKVNRGTVTHSKQDEKSILTLSEDFQMPEAPDPHWRVVDSQGNAYLLDKLSLKGGRFQKSITLPGYIHDVVKVQIWCSFAETLLGEASFSSPVM
jgi:hypothetical protein